MGILKPTGSLMSGYIAANDMNIQELKQLISALIHDYSNNPDLVIRLNEIRNVTDKIDRENRNQTEIIQQNKIPTDPKLLAAFMREQADRLEFAKSVERI